MSIYVDREYRTRLGTGFYDRAKDLEDLSRKASVFKTLIIYGPRNVGKSELVRYWLRKRGLRFVGIDVREKSSKEFMRRVLDYSQDLKDLTGDLVGAVAEALTGSPRLPDLLGKLLKTIWNIYRDDEIVVFVDEFHLLPGYERNLEGALLDLETLAGWLAKNLDLKVRLILTVSENFFSTAKAMSKLLGYSTTWLLVEELDEDHFRELYKEYTSIADGGCSIDLETILSLTGTNPGYLIEICSMSTKELILKVGVWLSALEKILREARDRLKKDPKEIIRTAYRSMKMLVKPLVDSDEYSVGEILVENNIAYMKLVKGGYIVKPQIPLYARALEIAVEKGLESMLDIDVEKLITKDLHAR